MPQPEQQRPLARRVAGTGRRDARPERTGERPPSPQWEGLFLEPELPPQDEEEA